MRMMQHKTEFYGSFKFLFTFMIVLAARLVAEVLELLLFMYYTQLRNCPFCAFVSHFINGVMESSGLSREILH